MKFFVPIKAATGIFLKTVVLLLLPAFSFAQSDNCATPTAIISAPGCVNTAGTLTGATYTPGLGVGFPGCGVANLDVWYSFVANSTNPTITTTLVAGLGQRRSQLFSGACGALTSIACSGNSNTLAATGLIVGQTYRIRVYSNNASAYNFTICITDPHNACASSVLLTSGPVCNNIPGNMFGSTLDVTSITAPNCATGATRDVWYRFVAQTTNPTISLTSIGAGFTNPGIQLLDNSCGGPTTTFFCGTTSIAADFLVPGFTYLIRVYSTTAAAPVTSVGAGFNICITDPVAPTPPNDECLNAINLLTNPSCSNVPGTVSGATPSSIGAVGCSGAVAYDVWYKFTAISTTSTITLSGVGSNFNTPRLQLFSGVCGSLTSMACGTTSIVAATVAGTTYYVRAYSATGPASNGDSDFDICVAGTGTGGQVRYGNSYVNITRKTAGGVVQNGDILEVRMTINHTVTSGTFRYLRFVDNVPTYTTIANAAPHDSIRIITNEGLTYKKYQLNAASDAASYLASPPVGQFNIRLNLGFVGSNPGVPPDNSSGNVTNTTGTMNAATNRPRGGGGMLFAIAYRVQVTGLPGDKIIMNSPRFIYNDGTTDVTLTGIPFEILISDPLTLCANSIGLSIASESGGTFGNGTSTNRSTDLNFPISGYSFVSNMNANNDVGDGRYAIVKNMSPRSRTVQTARRENTCNTGPVLNINDPLNCNNRMYGHWDINGDHSGTNTATGNLPPASGTNSGYMLMVNADFVASEIYRQSITNLCPNTYYEFSAWIRNICPSCGIDSTGTSLYNPGVYPNLTFALDNVDYYNSGEVDINGWQKRGFVFKTGPLQTTATFSIRNNSQGGGGNDWALDDIAVATCFPNMVYSPSAAPNVCQSDILTITDTVRSIFDNYVQYKWQRSTSGPGGPWVDIPGATGTATPVLISGVYQYVSTYTIPGSATTAANDGDSYRLVVASTTSNLSGTTCSYSDPSSITLNVLLACGPPLKAELLSATGKLTAANTGKISWVTTKEDEPVSFSIERSDDGINFKSIALIDGYNNITVETNSYNYTDPVTIISKVYYRVVMINNDNRKKYSGIIRLTTDEKQGFNFGAVVNPFTTELEYELISSNDGFSKVDLIDSYGKIVKSQTIRIYPGVNALKMNNTDNLSKGLYIIKASLNETITIRKVLKN